jgi:hypothetical protein
MDQPVSLARSHPQPKQHPTALRAHNQLVDYICSAAKNVLVIDLVKDVPGPNEPAFLRGAPRQKRGDLQSALGVHREEDPDATLLCILSPLVRDAGRLLRLVAAIFAAPPLDASDQILQRHRRNPQETALDFENLAPNDEPASVRRREARREMASGCPKRTPG